MIVRNEEVGKSELFSVKETKTIETGIIILINQVATVIFEK